MVWLKHCLLILMSTMLFACGGDGGVDLANGGSSGNDGSEEPCDCEAVLTVSLYDCKNVPENQIPTLCNSTNSISLDSPATVVMRLLDPEGAAAANEIVNLVSEQATPSSPQVLTDANGYAIATLFAKVDSAAAGTITATDANYGAEGKANYSVGATDLVMSMSSSLPTGEELAVDATATFTVRITNADNELYTTPVSVAFTSSCAENNLASISETVTTINGIATAIYEPKGCSGTDTVTATPSLSVLNTEQLDIDIATTTASSIAFVSAAPTTIYLAESVGDKIATLTFKVLDKVGQAKSGQTVDFSSDSDLHGLTFSPESAESNAEGLVVTRVTSGNMPGVALVSASFIDEENITVSTVSNSLAIHTGVPSQQGLSLSAETLAVEAWNVDGVAVNVTMRISDENSNPVPDGTAVYFETDGGQVAGSCFTTGQTTNSQCSVQWTSQNSRPQGHTNQLPQGACTAPGIIPAFGAGRLTVLGVTVGQESFYDANGNHIFDSGETYSALGEAWVDSNENGIRDTNGILIENNANKGEEFRDYNSNLEFDLTTGVKNSNTPSANIAELYNGLLCTVENDAAGICTRDLVETRDSLVMIMATSAANILLSDSSNTSAVTNIDVTSGPVSLTLTVQDLNGNQMPAGTTVSIGTTNGELGDAAAFVIPDGVGLCSMYQIVVEPESSPNGKSVGLLTISTESPNGLITSRTITVTDAG